MRYAQGRRRGSGSFLHPPGFALAVLPARPRPFFFAHQRAESIIRPASPERTAAHRAADLGCSGLHGGGRETCRSSPEFSGSSQRSRSRPGPVVLRQTSRRYRLFFRPRRQRNNLRPCLFALAPARRARRRRARLGGFGRQPCCRRLRLALVNANRTRSRPARHSFPPVHIGGRHLLAPLSAPPLRRLRASTHSGGPSPPMVALGHEWQTIPRGDCPRSCRSFSHPVSGMATGLRVRHRAGGKVLAIESPRAPANFLNKPPEEPPGQVREHNASRAAGVASAHCLLLPRAATANYFEPCARPELEPPIRCRRETWCYESSGCPPLRGRSNLRRCAHCLPVGGSHSAQRPPAQSPLLRDGHDRRTASFTRSLFRGRNRRRSRQGSGPRSASLRRPRHASLRRFGFARQAFRGRTRH